MHFQGVCTLSSRVVRALISVYDKSGVVELAQQLKALGVDLLSSGGTAAVIAEAGIEVTDVADVTGFPAMLGHRVVTLHPKVHGGILADRRDPQHLRDLEDHSIDLIDLVVVNLYPFSSEPSIDLIDIGGPTLLRAAAKNHEHVTVVVDPADYESVLAEMSEAGKTSSGLRKRLAGKAFKHSASYDTAISNWIVDEPALTDETVSEKVEDLPESFLLSLEKAQGLRYGENPHQMGARYRVKGEPNWWDEVEQLGGVDLSYLNFFDADAAWTLAHNLSDGPACAIIKHANPCGAAVGETLAVAYRNAFACDERSAFGGIVACNSEIDLETVEAMEAAAQADVVIAPSYADGVVERLIAKRKNTRILKAPVPKISAWTLRQLSQGYLVQRSHHFANEPDTWEVVTDRQPTSTELADARLAWKVCSHVSSNSIVLVKDGTAWGVGAGQQNRVEAGEIAVQKADGRAKGGACASDAFFPFADGLEVAASAGVGVVVQPGGSVNDSDVIAAANSLGIAMIFTGERQFKH